MSLGNDSAPHILMVDDDEGLRSHVAGYLGHHGFVVHAADRAEQITPLLRAHPIRLIILDVIMPGEDGLTVCRRLSGAGGPAIIIMSGMGEESDRVLGLEMGADDYIVKPTAPRELLARVRSVLRRTEQRGLRGRNGPADYQFAGYHLDMQRQLLSRPNGFKAVLTGGEFNLLTTLLDRPGQILSRDELAAGAPAPVEPRAIDVQVSRLRRKLDLADTKIIRTVRSGGYLLAAEVSRV